MYQMSVSIRAARAGRDALRSARRPGEGVFLSARPVRAATAPDDVVIADVLVSIRAARAGRDAGNLPAGAVLALFLSARPVRAATAKIGAQAG